MTQAATISDAGPLGLAALRRGFAGQLLLPGVDDFEAARRVWNAMVDRQPAIIARCASPADVAAPAARRYGAAVAPFASGVYVNALTDEGAGGVRRAYRPDQLARLATLKDRYDPGNAFHLNHNIRPSQAVAQWPSGR